MDIRILSFNIHKGIGWTTRKSMLVPLINHLKELDSDIIFLQEIRGQQYETLINTIWPFYCYGLNVNHKKGHYGNAILSKLPITYSTNLDLSLSRVEKRGMLHAIVKLDNEAKIHLLCVHLGLFRKDRKFQMNKIQQYIEQNIGNDEPMILGGDFNDWNNFATKTVTHHLGLIEAFHATHGRFARTYPAWAPVFKLDRIYLRGFKIDKAHRLLKKTWRFLSDHIAIEASLHR